MAIGVKYIGKSEDHSDRLYGTGLHFNPGQVYSIEDDVAKRMLLHTDTYEKAKAPKGAEVVCAVVESVEDNDRRNAPPMLDFTKMPDGELRDFARLHFNESLPTHALHQTLVDRVVAFHNRMR